MDFSGWEKMSLVDYDDNLTTTLFTAGCNFRCPFCHNSDLVLRPGEAAKIPWEEIKAYLVKRKGMLDAVCITGGEPTMMPDLLDKMREIKALGYKIKLDSNGTRPDILKKAYEEGIVDYIAMDIKNSPKKYASTIGVENYPLDKIKESVKFLKESGIAYEFRTTIMSEFHTKEDMKEIGEWIEGANRYFLQLYVDSEHCISHGFHALSKEEAEELLEAIKPYVPNAMLRSYE